MKTNAKRMIFLCGLAVLLGSSLPAAAQNSCRAAAVRMLVAGLFDVQDDYYSSLAKARNLESAEETAEAEAEAREEREAARLENQQVYDGRIRLCTDLGEDKYRPEIDPDNFLTPEEIAAAPSPYWPMVPGNTWTYRGETEDGTETIVVTVTDETREILGVECVVVLDVASLDGEVIEETYDWFAQDLEGNVWYFGEETFEYEDGRVVSIDGSFQAGEDGAQPGTLFKAGPAEGDLYRQEYLLGEAEDVALVWALGEEVTLADGTMYGDCVKTAEWTPLDPHGLEFKYYAPGVGLVREESLTGETVELVSFTTD